MRVEILLNHNLLAIVDSVVELAGMFSEPRLNSDAASVVLVTVRDSTNELAKTAQQWMKAGETPGFKSLIAVGDCLVAGLVSEAVINRNRAVRGLDGPDLTDLPFRVEQDPARFDPLFPWTAAGT